MSALIFGLAFIGALMFGARYYNTIPPAERARMLRRAGAALAFLFALGLAATGRAFLAVPLAFFGGLLLWRRPKFGTATERLTGGPRLSSVRTAFLEMTLDQSTGALSGHVLAGSFTGRDLGGLSRADLAALWRECRAGEPQSRQLLEAYLDRRWPEWRAEMPRSGGADNGASSNQGNGGSRAPMTRAEAHEVLGLPPGASIDDIKSAHRNLMKRLHPDQGGSNYLAAKINEAKDILTGKRP
jgi:hypothetical protein